MLSKQARLVLIHLLRLFFADSLSPLLLSQHFDSLYATHALILVGTAQGHVQSVALHGLVPCHSMVLHGVIDDTIHIEKHGFRAELPEAVFF